MSKVNNRFYRVCLAGMLAVAMVTGVSAWAVPPETVNIHGLLVDASGNPLPGDRAYVLRFFDAETDGAQLGGDLTGTVDVSDEGLFNLPVPLPPEALAAPELWYELGIDTDTPPDGDAEDNLFPDRIQVHSVPFALEAGTVTQVDADRIGAGTVDNATFGHLAGVMQPIQSALDEKADAGDLNSHAAATDNPHGVTAAQVGLGNVDNTSDEDKPVSTAMQVALETKADAVHDHDDLWRLGGNAGTSPANQFLGTTDDVALELRVNNARAMRIVPGTVTPNLIGGFNENAVRTEVTGAIISGGGGVKLFNLVTDNYGAIGGGSNNQAGNDDGDPATARYATVGGGVSNTASHRYATVGGGLQNTASAECATVGGGHENTASGLRSTIGGGYSNDVQASYGTIAGGGPSVPANPAATRNRVTGNYGAIGGGGNNQAGNDDGLPTTARYATVGGGQNNNASLDYATVSGGQNNIASGWSATVGGGQNNNALSDYATVPGGRNNTASGSYSFAAGRRAKAYYPGAFVWGDNTDADVASTASNQFTVRASGGVRFYTNSDLNTGVTLSAGSGSWSSVSDRNVKENFVPVDGVEVLEKVAALPISTWNYKSQDASIRHIGPMAQDVYAAFGLGGSDTTITAIDADGIALAAIQGLNQRLEQRLSEKDREIAALRKKITTMKAMLQEVVAR